MKTRRNDNVVRLSHWRQLRRPAGRKGPGAPAFAQKILESENRKRDWKLGVLVMLSTFLIGLIVVVVLPIPGTPEMMTNPSSLRILSDLSNAEF